MYGSSKPPILLNVGSSALAREAKPRDATKVAPDCKNNLRDGEEARTEAECCVHLSGESLSPCAEKAQRDRTTMSIAEKVLIVKRTATCVIYQECSIVKRKVFTVYCRL